MTYLVVLRHGNTFDPGDVVRRVGGRTDLPLSVSGRAQADQIGRHFAEQFSTFDRVISAPLRRTLETAERVVKFLSTSPDIEIDAGFREIDYGPDEGCPEADVVQRIGATALALWDREAIPPAGWQIDPEVLTAQWQSLITGLAGLGPAARVLVVTSNGIARFVLNAVYASPDLTRKLRTGAYGTIDINATGQAVVREWDVCAGEQI